MNTLEDLNNRAQQPIYFNDDRPYSIAYTTSTSVGAVSATEDSEVNVDDTWDGSIQTLQSIDNTGDGIKIEVDLSSFPVNGLVEWGTLPSGVTVSETSANVFEAKNIYKIADYNTLIDNAKISTNDVASNTTYTIKAYYPDITNPAVYNADTQTVSLTITSTSDEMTTPTTAAEYQEDATNVATDLPTIIDNPVTDTTYNFTITPSSTAVIDSYNYTPPPSGSGTTVTFNSSTKKLTINGTKTNVQNVIDSITLNPTANSDVSYTFNYVLTNNVTALQTTSSAAVTVQPLVEIDNIGLERDYTENTITTNLFSTNAPTISSALSDPSYTVRFDITTYNNTASEGYLIDNSSSNPAAKFITYTGTQSQVDAWMASNVRYIPPANISSQQQIKVTLTSASQGTDVSYFYVNGTANATPVPGTGTFTYTSDTTNQSFTDEQKYFLKCDVLVVGAGGNGGTAIVAQTIGSSTYPAMAGGGGGAGALLYGVNVDLLAKAEGNLDFLVGQVGSGTGNSVIEANAVSSTYITCLKGGDGGNASNTGSGSGQAGGQGGGASGSSSTAGAGTTPTYSITALTGGSITTQSRNGYVSPIPYYGGVGGPTNEYDTTGILFESDISGSNQYYCAGGWGGESIWDTDWPSRYCSTKANYPGSGGVGQYVERTLSPPSTPNYDCRSDGNNGIIILKLYSS